MAPEDEMHLLDEALDAFLATNDPAELEPAEFLGRQFDAGLAFVHLPNGEGGRGLSPVLQRRVNDRMRGAGARSAAGRNPIGVAMGFPTVQAHGTQEQKSRYLRPCFTGAEVWCQLFSEPGSGSDLAGLSTRAVKDGEEWVVNGQKVWTSLAHRADVGLLIARTDPDVPKHKGLTYFLVDMHAAGVEVRPLREMTGSANFNEVFLTDLRLPDACRIGEPGTGWRVAATTMMNERVALSGAGGGLTNVGGSSVDRLVELARKSGDLEPVLRDEVTKRWIEGQAIRLTNERGRATRSEQPGPEGSVTKLFQGLYNRRLQETLLRVLGARSIGWNPADEEAAAAVFGFLRSQANTIEGGTSNIQRNVVGERVLGLPREPGPDRETPWAALPRNG